MKRLVFTAVAAWLWSTALLGAPVAAKSRPISVLILDGESAGPYHDWRLTTAVLKKELEKSGLFRVSVATAPRFGEDFSGFKPEFGKYQVVVSNLDAPDWPDEEKTQLAQYVRGGGGLVVVHAADNSFPDWPAYNEMTGVGGWRGRSDKAGPMWYFKDGKLVPDETAGAAGSHGARLPFQVTIRRPEHPIMKGLPSVWMHTSDELYATLRGPGKNMTVLATAHSDPKNKGTDRDEPSIVVLNYGKGRVFHTMMGHDVAALSCVGFMTTFQRGTEWAATGRVTQKVPANFPSAETASYRVDIAEMDPAALRGPMTSNFDGVADAALAAMRKRAEELKIEGVAVVAYFEGETVQAWNSKMAVVGKMKTAGSGEKKGSNLLGIAYAKASEMADTLKDSGTSGRPPMTGEFGWNGGVIVRGRQGFLIAAFSGGKSEDDVMVSRAGVEELKKGL